MKHWGKQVAIGMLTGVLLVGLTGCQNPAEGGTEVLESSIVEVPEDDNVVVELTNESEDVDLVSEETKNKLEKVEKLIDENFYFEDEEQAKQDGIIRGYVEGLGDPYSVYYTKEEFDKFTDTMSNKFVGVGIIPSQDRNTNAITVADVCGPAKEAGIEIQDVVTKIDGEDITSLDIEVVSNMLLGEEGSEVTITVYRVTDGKEHEFTIERQKIELPTLEYRMLENNIGYIQVKGFYESVAQKYYLALLDLNSQGMEGLIIDLRSNSGGLMDIAVQMLEYTLPKGKITDIKDKEGSVIGTYSASGKYQFDKPLVVLVNEDSASASELFTGAIKDYGIGTIIGKTTYGKGIGQNTFSLGDGSAVKLTIFEFFTPNGNTIHKIGIVPDVEVEFDVAAYAESGGENDNQLQAAIDNIMKKIGE